jgi:protease IV
MTARILGLIFLCAGLCFAEEPTAMPAGETDNQLEHAKPQEQPLDQVKEIKEAAATEQATKQAEEGPATQPTPVASPATKPTAKSFPTPAELVAKMKKVQETEANQTRVAYFNLARSIVEKPADFSLFGEADAVTLHSLLQRMRKAREDKEVRAVLVTLGGVSMNLAQAQEIRDALIDLRRSDKKTFVYADSYDTISYTIASGATNVCLLEGGQIMIPGVGMEAMFYKGILDKVGVRADYVQIGEYKGAEEPYTRSEPSAELRGELQRLTEAMYEQIVDGISMGRSVSREAVRQLIDDTMVSAAGAKDRGFVDHLVDQDGLRELIKAELGNDINLLHNFGLPERQSVDLSNPFSILTMMSRRPEDSPARNPTKPQIAVVYVDGMIADGESAESLFGGSVVGSESLRRALRIAVRDEQVKAVLLRIDSPGGSALASEVVWQAARRVAEKKPVIVSIGSMAASGGYYIASAGDYIFADPSAIVGSIGVVGGKFVLKDLYDKVGLTTQSFEKGRNANLFSSISSFDERQRRMITTWMKQTYDQFTDRIVATRKEKISNIDAVARGRIFLAQQAKELGMVDEIGGTQAALAHAAKLAKLDDGDFTVRILPAPRTLADMFAGVEPEATFPFRPQVTLSPDSILQLLPQDMRRSFGQQLQAFELLQQHPVLLVSPYVLSVK